MKLLFIIGVLVIGALAKDKTIKDDKTIGHLTHDIGDTNVLRLGDIYMMKVSNRLNKFNFDQNQKRVIDDFLVHVDHCFKNCKNEYVIHKIDYRYRQCVGINMGRIMRLINDLDRFGFDRFNTNFNVLFKGINDDSTTRDYWNRDDVNRDNLNRDSWNRDNLNRDNWNRDNLDRDIWNRDIGNRDIWNRDNLDRGDLNRDYLNVHRDTFRDTGRFGVYDVDRDSNVRGVSNRYDLFDTDRHDINWNKDLTGRFTRDVVRNDDLNTDLGGYLGLIVYGVGVDRDVQDRVGHNIGDNWNRFGNIDYYGHGKNLYNRDRLRNIYGNTDVDRDIYGRYGGGDRDVVGRNIYGRDNLHKYGGDRDLYGDVYGRRGLDVNRNVGTDNLYFGLRDGYDRDVTK